MKVFLSLSYILGEFRLSPTNFFFSITLRGEMRISLGLSYLCGEIRPYPKDLEFCAGDYDEFNSVIFMGASFYDLWILFILPKCIATSLMTFSFSFFYVSFAFLNFSYSFAYNKAR
jgi:hypothetical protein